MSYDASPQLAYLHPLCYVSAEELAAWLPKIGNPVACETRLRAELRKRSADFKAHNAHILINGKPAYSGFLWASSTWEATKQAPPIEDGSPYASQEIIQMLPMLAEKLNLLPPLVIPAKSLNAFIGGVAVWNPNPPIPKKQRLHFRRANKTLWGVVK